MPCTRYGTAVVDKTLLWLMYEYYMDIIAAMVAAAGGPPEIGVFFAPLLVFWPSVHYTLRSSATTHEPPG